MSNILKNTLEPVLEKESLKAYYRRMLIYAAVFLILFSISFTIRGKSYYGDYILGVFILAGVLTLWDVIRHKSLYQLRKAEVEKGRAEAQKILEDAGIKK